MTKAELIAKVAGMEGITKALTGRVLDSIVAVMDVEIIVNGRFVLPGIGIFRKVKRKARTGRNPRTGVEVKIRSKQGIRFKPAAEMSRRLNS